MNIVIGDQEEGMVVGTHSMGEMDSRVCLMEDDTIEVVVPEGKTRAASQKMELGRGRQRVCQTQDQGPGHHRRRGYQPGLHTAYKG